MRLKTKMAALAAGATMLAAGSAGATMTTFDITWSGAYFGNTARAYGFITLDTALLPGPVGGPFVFFPDPRVTALSIDVSGATTGNGHFDLNDYITREMIAGLSFHAPAGLDLTKELIGQDVGPGCKFGEIGRCSDSAFAYYQSGDFEIVALGGPMPAGFGQFTLSTSQNDHMLVTSIKPVVAGVPEPATWALMLLGFGGVGGLLRRRRAFGALA